MSSLLADYPFRKTRDIRSAMAETLAQYILTFDFDLPVCSATKPSFAEVYDTWADFESNAKSAGGRLPAAAILPDKGTYDDSSFTPRMLEETWKTDGRDGWALYAIAEYDVPFLVVVRAKSSEQRKAIVSHFEDAFVETTEPADPDPGHYGKRIAMPSYYGRIARFTLLSQELLDSSEFAIRNRWMAQFEFTAQAQHCVLRRVPAMAPHVHVVINGLADNR